MILTMRWLGTNRDRFVSVRPQPCRAGHLKLPLSSSATISRYTATHVSTLVRLTPTLHSPVRAHT